MKRIALWFSGTTTVLVLLFSYHTSTSGSAVAHAAGTVAATGVVTASPTTTAPTTTGATPTPSSTTTSSTTRTVNGAAVSTRYGDVQVQVVMSGTRIVKATAISYSTNGRDGEINAYAIPVLQQETVSTQSASIDTVSGATYTSQGYIQSLQSALDAAHA